MDRRVSKIPAAPQRFLTLCFLVFYERYLYFIFENVYFFVYLCNLCLWGTREKHSYDQKKAFPLSLSL